MKFLILVSLAGLLLFAAQASALTLAPDECVNITAFNSTDNMTYNVSVCAPGKCVEILNLTSNGTISRQNGSCDINITVAVPPVIINNTINNTVIQNVTVYDKICTASVALDPGQNFINTTAPCNINFTSKSGSCPMCPPCAEGKCTVDETIFPTNSTQVFEWSNDSCDVHIRVAEHDACFSFNIPEDYKAVPASDVENYNKQIDMYATCTEDLSSQKTVLNVTQTRMMELEKDFCPISDDKLLAGWDSMAKYEKTYLDTFMKVTQPIDYVMFSDLIAPPDKLCDAQENKSIDCISGTTKINTDFYAGLALQKYEKIGFAETTCEQIYDTRYKQNTTLCMYKPIITEPCINRTIRLGEIKGAGYMTGSQNTLMMGGLSLLIFMILLILAARAPFMPGR